MPRREDRIRFLEDPVRRRVAELCRERPMSLGELGVELGRPAGSLSQPQTMVGRGALVTTTRLSSLTGRSSRAFRLARTWRDVLAEVEQRVTPAWPAPGRDLVVVPFSDVRAVANLLSDDAAGVEWAAEVRGGVAGLLLSPRAGHQADGARLLARLSEVAEGLATLRVERVMSQGELQSWSRLVSDKAALPKGGSQSDSSSS
jgi:hypothetical protein